MLDSLRQKNSIAEIAARLFVSQATVRSHVAWLLRKLGLPIAKRRFRLFDASSSR